MRQHKASWGTVGMVSVGFLNCLLTAASVYPYSSDRTRAKRKELDMQSVQKTRRAPLKARPREVTDAEFEQAVRDLSDRYKKTLEYLAR